MTRDEIVRETRGWIGCPYRRRGRSRKGVDCIGLVVVVSYPFEIVHIDQTDYSDYPHPDRLLLQAFDRFLTPVHPDSPFPGTIGVFTASVLPVHTGIFTEVHGKVHFVHARKDEGMVIEQEYRPQDRHGRLIARYAYPGLEG